MIESRTLALVPPRPAHADELYHLLVETPEGQRLRYRGATPSRERFLEEIMDGVLAQYVVVRKETDELLGIMIASTPDFHNGTCYVATAFLPAHQRRVVGMLSFIAFVRLVFENWSFRLLYADASETTFTQFRSGSGKYFEVEGIRKAADFSEGRYLDRYLLTIERENFLSTTPHLVDRWFRL